PPLCPDGKLLDYKSVARFDEQIERYIRRFGEDRVRVGFVDQLNAAPRAFYLGLLDFLQLPDDGRDAFPRLGPSKGYRSSLARDVVRLGRTPHVQSAVQSAKRLMGIKGKIGWVRRFQLRNTVSTEKAALPPDLAAEIADHYAESYARTQAIAASVPVAVRSV
ncbi:MAG TPA: hypothetical protein VF122_05440, partial [Caulobacteraceae bacterium]